MFPDHRNHKKGGHCLTDIYFSLSELNIKIFITFSRSVPDKLIETKKPPENIFISPRATQNISSLVRSSLQQCTYWLEWYLGKVYFFWFGIPSFGFKEIAFGFGHEALLSVVF